MVSVELACLIRKLHLPGSSEDGDDWDLVFFFFLGFHLVKSVSVQILEFPSYLPKFHRLAETVYYNPLGRWMLVFNRIPGKVKEVTEAGLFDPAHM